MLEYNLLIANNNIIILLFCTRARCNCYRTYFHALRPPLNNIIIIIIIMHYSVHAYTINAVM